MSGQVLQQCASRRSLCFSCLQFCRAKAYYSHSALAFSSTSRPQNSEISNAAGTSGGGKTRTQNRKEFQEATTNTRSPLEPTRVDRYLASIRAAGLEPTLEDVERYRPGKHSRPESLRYAEEYTNLLEALCRSFSKDQLRGFSELYNLDPIWTRSSRRKMEYAESIIEKAWGWPSLKEIERKRRDRTEVVVKTFSVTPSQLFLILGKDGADLLQLSMQYNVHISLTSNPLALRVEGLRGVLKELTEHMNSLKKGIIDKIFELPTGRLIRPDLMQRISRLAGAYVESHGNKGKIRICAKDINNMKVAERLALRASLEGGTEARSSIVCYNPPGTKSNSPMQIAMPHKYSVYPFLTPSTSPWTMNPGSTFRIRRVADWLGVDSYEDIAKTGGLVDNYSRLLNLAEADQDLRQLISRALPGDSVYRRRLITASLGHLLLSPSNSERTNILPPLKGTWALPKILRWVETSKVPLSFFPSLPPTMMLATPGKRRVLHRLVYRTLPQLAGDVSQLPQQALKFEVELAGALVHAQAPQCLEDTRNHEDSSSSDEVIIDRYSPSSEKGGPQPGIPRDKAVHSASSSRCHIGKETFINLMMPDRPMDLQLSIFDYEDIVLSQPLVLREYAEKLRNSHRLPLRCGPEYHNSATPSSEARLSQPDPPSAFNHEGREYYLHDSWSLRQSDDPIAASTISGNGCAEDSVKVYSESVVDLESTQKIELCQVKFDGTAEDLHWKHFLATCDQLSAVPLQPRSKKDETQADFLEE
ncbi:hypothetical protein PAXRUDRAFT_823202 [Paxillus rubicundulus Ve08.2h10]|uniref:Unplaced genomic scaffold scaffold_50, whole genome shotgun sequence n=1 Tax=Paxillus rubicundulus Ve08.2h10 TaxID=930991 RepID=A0A0D0ECA6_9AGAM|nr:hypothetical protein PAXRUDRAFT_823202 [Paxillus rubicundulus Ve08.2h10]